MPPLMSHTHHSSAQDVSAILEARHFDPFSFLGPHHLDGTDTAVVRSFQPAARTVEVVLSAEETKALLDDVRSAHDTELNDVLLSAFAEALSACLGADTVCVGLMHHGRESVVEDVDVSRTVGWFSSLFPLWLKVPLGGEPGALLKGVKEELRAVPMRGVGYGWLRHAHPDEAVRASLSVKIPAVFNYHGQFEAASDDQRLHGRWDFAGMSTSRSPRAALSFELTMSCIVMQGRLQFVCLYSPAAHDTSTVERLMERYLSSLRQLIAH